MHYNHNKDEHTSGSGKWCIKQTRIALTSVIHNDIQRWQCHAVLCTEASEISHLWHILFFTCCEIIISNDLAVLI